MWLLLLLACPPAEDASKPINVATETDCDVTPALVVPLAVEPGSTVAVEVTGEVTGAGEDTGEIEAWEVTGWEARTEGGEDLGTLEATGPRSAAWAVSEAVGVHTDATATLTATLTRDGCDAVTASAQVTLGFAEARRVVVLYNPAVDGSARVATAYAAARGIDDRALCPVEAADPVTLPGEDYPAFLDAVRACADAVGPQVHYLAPVYGVPYKVSDRVTDLTGGSARVVISLDALLAFASRSLRIAAPQENPYYLPGDSMAGVWPDYVPFGVLREDGEPYWMVARLDGATPDAALALVDRALEAEALQRDALAGLGDGLTGVAYVDGNQGDTPPTTDDFGSYASGEWDMWGTRAVFEADYAATGRWPVVWDGHSEEFGTAPAPLTCPDALFYAGWYSFYHYNDAFTWQPGAVGGHLDSCSACEIRAEGTWSGSALARGITATFGAVNEPYVAGMPSYDQLFRMLLQGASFGEAAAESTRVGAWMMVWVGDPLYRPFPAP